MHYKGFQAKPKNAAWKEGRPRENRGGLSGGGKRRGTFKSTGYLGVQRAYDLYGKRGRCGGVTHATPKAIKELRNVVGLFKGDKGRSKGACSKSPKEVWSDL